MIEFLPLFSSKRIVLSLLTLCLCGFIKFCVLALRLALWNGVRANINQTWALNNPYFITTRTNYSAFCISNF